LGDAVTLHVARAAEVVQLHARAVEASVTRPLLELRGFHRVHPAPGVSSGQSPQLNGGGGA
jgi:hypothetical protein